MEKLTNAIIIIVLAIIVSSLFFSLPVMWLWNVALVPAVPGLNTIGFFQALGILILTGLLFGRYTNNSQG